MTKTPKPVEPLRDGAVRNYVFFCATALVVIFLILFRQNRGLASFLPVLFGLFGVALRWRFTVPAFLLMMGGILSTSLDASLLASTIGERGQSRGLRLEDWMLSGAMLAFVAAHCRLLTLTVPVGPTDGRAAGTSSGPGHLAGKPADNQKFIRDPNLVSPSEIGALILALPLWALLAQICWRYIPQSRATLDIRGDTWTRALPVVTVAWALAVAVLVCTFALNQLRLGRMRHAEARMFLRDVLWRETRREQRRIQLWRAWAAVRHRMRKGEP